MLRVQVLGDLSAEVDGEPIELPRARAARSLLAYLAWTGRVHQRGELAARFWPDVLDASARGSLRTALSELRRVFDGVEAERETVGLRADVWTDIREFRALLDAGRIEEALALQRGEPLGGLDDDWVHEARRE